jgi:predicted phosphodiesterase
MQTIVIGDLHGRKTGLEIARKHPNDKLVFLGDYFDSKTGVPIKEQLDIFEYLIALKLQNFERVILLTGNHDLHYIKGATQIYTGYQWQHASEISLKMTHAYRYGLLQAAYQQDSYLCVHAGITRTWSRIFGINPENAADAVNTLFRQQIRPFEFIRQPGCNSDGNNIYQGPFWVRPDSLRADGIAGYTQVIGHTQFAEPQFLPGIIALDVLAFCSKYLIINQKGETTLAEI